MPAFDTTRLSAQAQLDFLTSQPAFKDIYGANKVEGTPKADIALVTYDSKKNLLPLNGELTQAATYANTHSLYFRLRARREDQRFDPNAKDKDGSPKIYGVSPSRGDSAGRIVVTDKVPTTGVIVNI
jgi:hypothetical protein